MNFLESNLIYLTSKGFLRGDEADTVRDSALPAAYSATPSDEGADSPSLCAESGGTLHWFHDARAPMASARRTASAIKTNASSLLAFGLGLGYELEAILDARPELRSVCVIETEPALYRETLARIDFSAYPEIRWFPWLGDLSSVNFKERLNAFYGAAGDETMGVVRLAGFMSFNRLFIERLVHTERMMDNLDVVRKLSLVALQYPVLKVSAPYLMQMFFDIQFPDIIRIEPTSFCNIRCRICPTHSMDKSKKGFMDPATYKAILDELKSIAPDKKYYIILYIGGEPLMHKKLCDMIETAASYGYLTQINTNCTLLTDDLSERLIKSGLTQVSFSLDDMKPEEFEKYRKGSNYELVYNNIRRFIKIRESLKSKSPAICIPALKIPKDREACEATPIPPLSEEFTRRFEGLPVNFMPFWAHHWASAFIAEADGMISRRAPFDSYYPCSMLWQEMSVRWDGTVIPCCYDLLSDLPLGKFPESSLREIWTNEAYTRLRQAHVCERIEDVPLCMGCSCMGTNMKPYDAFFAENAPLYKKRVNR